MSNSYPMWSFLRTLSSLHVPLANLIPMPTPPILPQAHKEAIGSILDEHIVFTSDKAIQIFIIYLFWIQIEIRFHIFQVEIIFRIIFCVGFCGM